VNYSKRQQIAPKTVIRAIEHGINPVPNNREAAVGIHYGQVALLLNKTVHHDIPFPFRATVSDLYLYPR
jgi:hypothetical protein